MQSMAQLEEQAVRAKGNVRVNLMVCPWYEQSSDSRMPQQIFQKAIVFVLFAQARRAKGNVGFHFNIARPINGNRLSHVVHCHCHLISGGVQGNNVRCEMILVIPDD